MEPIRIAVIGLGAVAQSVHLPLLRRHPEVFEIAAVADISPSLTGSVAEQFGIPADRRFTAAAELLDQVVCDALLIASGGSHAPIVVDALARDIAVLCEKPLGITHAELDLIAEMLPADRPRLMVGYMKQYDPATTTARRLLGDVRGIRSVDVRVLHPTGASQLQFANLRTGAGDVPAEVRHAAREADRALWDTAFGAGTGDEDLWRTYAGCLMSSLSHDMSVLRYLLDPDLSVDFADIWRPAPVEHRRPTGRDAGGLGAVPPSIRAVGTLADDARFTLDWHYLNDYPAYRETVTIIHSAGSIELAFPSPYLLHAPTVLTTIDSAGEAEARTEFRSIGESFEIQLLAFADMVREGTPPQTGLAGARADVRTSQEIVRCYAERAGIRLRGEIEA